MLWVWLFSKLLSQHKILWTGEGKRKREKLWQSIVLVQQKRHFVFSKQSGLIWASGMQAWEYLRLECHKSWFWCRVSRKHTDRMLEWNFSSSGWYSTVQCLLLSVYCPTYSGLQSFLIIKTDTLSLLKHIWTYAGFTSKQLKWANS